MFKKLGGLIAAVTGGFLLLALGGAVLEKTRKPDPNPNSRFVNGDSPWRPY